MPRKYCKKIGARKYNDFTDDKIEKALNDVIDGKLSLLAASKQYGISYGTLYNRFKGLHGTKKIGGQTALSREEELAIVQCIRTCSDWGFPLSFLDVRIFTQMYLDRVGRIIPKFKNGNSPGKDWCYSFLNRHRSQLSVRMSQNISKRRAGVTREEITSYFENLKPVIDEVPSCNIFNFDETAMVDDPGKKKLIFRRGIKYPENILNQSKAQTTVMFCGAANGTLLPPYVIYKSDHLWQSWVQNGPKGRPCCEQPCCIRGTHYNRSKSGWIDATIFADWFQAVLIPHVKRLTGRKVVLGDNLAAHFSDTVIDLCRINEIDFVCLPPNTTHVTQPLDVSFFRSLKEAWQSEKNRSSNAVPKDCFPKLLFDALVRTDGSESKVSQNLVSGFSKCGIIPFNPQRVLQRLPSEDIGEEANEKAPEILVDFLKNNRFPANTSQPRQRRTRVNVAAGTSITAHDYDSTNESTGSYESDVGASTSSSTSTDDVNDISEPAGNHSAPVQPLTNTSTLSNETQSQENRDVSMEDVEINDFVVAQFMTNRRPRYFIGQIIQEENVKRISYLRKKVNKNLPQFTFQFPERVPDIQDFPGTGDQEHVKIVKKVVGKALKRGAFVFSNVHSDFLTHIE